MKAQRLEFEKPIVDMERQLQELKKRSKQLGVDREHEVAAMERKIEATRKKIYENLNPWERVQVARLVQRPFALDYLNLAFTDFTELHGDRLFGDDHAMPCGLACLGTYRCVVVSHQKGLDTKENIRPNFGIAPPDGYPKPA